MAIPPDTQLDDMETRRDLRLVWLACVGPCLWLTLLAVVYAVSDHECGSPTARYSCALTALGMLSTFGALWALERMRRRHESQVTALPDCKVERVRTMLHGALALNALSLVLLAGFLAPLIFLRPCE
jgi:hypothetical protein